MPRKRNTSTVEVLIDLASLLPWWLSVVLAGAAYFGLGHLAGNLPPMPSQMGGKFGFYLMYSAGVRVGQFILPIAFCIGAVLSLFAKLKRKSVVSSATGVAGAAALSGMSWEDFELLIGEAFRGDGYNVVENGGPGPDGGVDLRMRKGGEIFLVQCKHWKAFKVGVQVVREMYGLMAAHGAAGGFVVTSGRFTDEAVRFASGRNITLINGDELPKLIQRAKGTHEAVPRGRAAAIASAPGSVAKVVRAPAESPSTGAGKLSTSKIAPTFGLTTAQFLERVAALGYVEMRDGAYQLTKAGRELGAEWRTAYGGYILWPVDLHLQRREES